MGPSSASGLVRLCASRIEWLRELAATARSRKKASSSSEWFSIGSRTELRTKHIGPNTTSYGTAECLSDVTILVSAVSLCLPHRVASRGCGNGSHIHGSFSQNLGTLFSPECSYCERFFNRLKHGHAQTTSPRKAQATPLQNTLSVVTLRCLGYTSLSRARLVRPCCFFSTCLRGLEPTLDEG